MVVIASLSLIVALLDAENYLSDLLAFSKQKKLFTCLYRPKAVDVIAVAEVDVNVELAHVLPVNTMTDNG